MYSVLIKKLMLIISLALLCYIVKAQTDQTINSSNIRNKLNLTNSDKEIEHVFHITMSKKDFREVLSTDTIEKDFLSDCILIYNNDTLNLKELELRGNGSMFFKRKSFSVKLDDKISFNKNGTEYKFKKFNLISLSMDQNYYRNKVSFDLMSELKLFNLFYSFAEVIINGKTQGIYLIVQKPKNYAFKDEDANFMLRRDYKNVVKKTYISEDDTSLEARCVETFLYIYEELIPKKMNQEFYNALAEVLDVEQYFTWMSINYLIGNRDYTDEVFFYNQTDGDSIKFGIIPWDYDDVFFEHPHEGNLIRYFYFGDKLAFSSEDALDKKIVTDLYTYRKYLYTLSEVIHKISPELLKNVFESAYHDLYPYYRRKDILRMTSYDKYGKTNLKGLESDMQETYKWLIEKRESTETKLNGILGK